MDAHKQFPTLVQLEQREGTLFEVLDNLSKRPHWFHSEFLKSPKAVHLEAWLVEAIFRPGGEDIPHVECASHTLLRVNQWDPEGEAEILIFGRPYYQKDVSEMIMNLADYHRRLRAQSTGPGIGRATWSKPWLLGRDPDVSWLPRQWASPPSRLGRGFPLCKVSRRPNWACVLGFWTHTPAARTGDCPKGTGTQVWPPYAVLLPGSEKARGQEAPAPETETQQFPNAVREVGTQWSPDAVQEAETQPSPQAVPEAETLQYPVETREAETQRSLVEVQEAGTHWSPEAAGETGTHWSPESAQDPVTRL
ncbi:KH domain-containing protein 3 [Cynocephalus volans]|uniref:KH domain-containing protein 3 n=1 Tax=Cynocephalus volans TaxID=110931 RepID=UPI002FC61787